jgi:hypothetical protein
MNLREEMCEIGESLSIYSTVWFIWDQMIRIWTFSDCCRDFFRSSILACKDCSGSYHKDILYFANNNLERLYFEYLTLCGWSV